MLNICVCAMLIIPQPEDINYKQSRSRSTSEEEKSNEKTVKKLKTMDNDLTSDLSLPQRISSDNNNALHLTARVLSNVHFILLLINAIMLLFGSGVVFTHIMAFAQAQGSSASLGSMMISALGLSALLGRMGLGMLSQLPWVDTIILYALAVFITGQIQIIQWSCLQRLDMSKTFDLLHC